MTKLYIAKATLHDGKQSILKGSLFSAKAKNLSDADIKFLLVRGDIAEESADDLQPEPIKPEPIKLEPVKPEPIKPGA